jgi:hypothetical protein
MLRMAIHKLHEHRERKDSLDLFTRKLYESRVGKNYIAKRIFFLLLKHIKAWSNAIKTTKKPAKTGSIPTL